MASKKAKAGLDRGRSSKAGRPPEQPASAPQKARRRKTARAAIKKDTTLLQTGEETQVAWRASRPKGKKR